MIEVSRLRDEKEALLAAWRKKHFEAEPLVDQALAYDEERRTLQKKLDDLRHELNRLSKAIGEAMRQGQAAEADLLKAQTTTPQDHHPKLRRYPPPDRRKTHRNID
jgi:seryl-tRNA synthetase